jgi:hypothetical protein
MQKKILLTTGNLPRGTPTRDLHMMFEIPHLHSYYFIKKLCREQATVILNIKTLIFKSFAEAKFNVERIKGSDLVGVSHRTYQLTRAVVLNPFSRRTPTDTFPLNFVPPNLLVHNSSYT